MTHTDFYKGGFSPMNQFWGWFSGGGTYIASQIASWLEPGSARFQIFIVVLSALVGLLTACVTKYIGYVLDIKKERKLIELRSTVKESVKQAVAEEAANLATTVVTNKEINIITTGVTDIEKSVPLM